MYSGPRVFRMVQFETLHNANTTLKALFCLTMPNVLQNSKETAQKEGMYGQKTDSVRAGTREDCRCVSSVTEEPLKRRLFQVAKLLSARNDDPVEKVIFPGVFRRQAGSTWSRPTCTPDMWQNSPHPRQEGLHWLTWTRTWWYYCLTFQEIKPWLCWLVSCIAFLQNETSFAKFSYVMWAKEENLWHLSVLQVGHAQSEQTKLGEKVKINWILNLVYRTTQQRSGCDFSNTNFNFKLNVFG